MIVTPPWRSEGHARRWIRAHWPLATITPSYQVRDAAWFKAKGGRYVKEYAKAKWTPRQTEASANHPPKLEIGKSYQQDYDQLPREIRTWESNRLAHRVSVVLEHIDRYVTVNIAPLGSRYPRWRASWWIYERLVHRTDPGARCTLAEIKSPPPSATGDGRNQEDAGGYDTSGSVSAEADTSSVHQETVSRPRDQVLSLPLPF
jgi:hypothetical protein